MLTDDSDSGNGSDITVAVVVTAVAVVMARTLQVLLSSFVVVSSIFLFT